MKQEFKDVALQALLSSPTTLTAVISQLTVAERVAIILGVMQGMYLVRKWWREETEFGLKMKRWVGVRTRSTKPADLD